jgi:hypothetical protein
MSRTHIFSVDNEDIRDNFEAAKGWQESIAEELTDAISELCIEFRKTPDDLYFDWIGWAAKGQESLTVAVLKEKFRPVVEKLVQDKENKLADSKRGKSSLKNNFKTKSSMSRRLSPNPPSSRMSALNKILKRDVSAKNEVKFSKPVAQTDMSRPISPSVELSSQTTNPSSQSKQEQFENRKTTSEAFLTYGDAEIPKHKLIHNSNDVDIQLDNFGDKSMSRNVNLLRKHAKKRLNCELNEYIPIHHSHIDSKWMIGFVEIQFNDDSNLPTLDNLILIDADGNHAKLDFTGCLNPVSIFPGQVLRVFGTNNTGGAINVESCLWMDESEFKFESESEITTSTIIGIAAGPFTLDSDFNFSGLKGLKEKVFDSTGIPNIDCLILIGPFIPEKHVMLDELHDKTTVDLHNYFQSELETSFPGVKIVLVTAYDEAIGLGITPQPVPLSATSSKNIVYTSEPARIQINGASIFCSGNSAVMNQLIRGEITMGNANLKKIERLSKHVNYQESFTPSLAGGMNVDLEQMSDYLSFQGENPDLLVFPSQMKPSLVDNVLNVGQCIQHSMAGYFARVLITPESKQKFDALEVSQI